MGDDFKKRFCLAALFRSLISLSLHQLRRICTTQTRSTQIHHCNTTLKMASGSGSAMANKRLQAELRKNNPPVTAGTTIKLVNEDLYKWEIIMDGPPESIYSGGHFRIHLDFPLQFPFKPPTVAFQTKIWHPNVTNDDKGSMCLGILRPDVWKPASSVSGVLELIRALLQEPDIDDAVETSIADQYKNDRKAFEKQ